MKKKISIILTTYNGEKSIRNVIVSMLNQEGNNQDFTLELIVVDDCSTDKTISIVGEYDAILFTNSTNSGGPNKGRNKGLTEATGDYICIADQDDIWEKHRITSLLAYLNEVPIVTSGYTILDNINHKRIIRVTKSEKGSVYFKHNETFLARLTKSLKGQNTYLGSIIYRNELQGILFEETYGSVDFDWILRLFEGQDSIEVSHSLYTRTVDSHNLSLNEDYRKKDFDYSLMFVENYAEKYPKETKKARLKIHGSRARYYYYMGNMRKARFFFLRSQINLKTILYIITSFVGSSFVKKHFNIFG